MKVIKNVLLEIVTLIFYAGKQCEDRLRVEKRPTQDKNSSE